MSLPGRIVGLARAALLVTLAAPTAGSAETVAVRSPEDDRTLAEALRASPVLSLLVPRIDGLRVELGPEATGDVEIVVSRWPVPREIVDRLAVLPVELGEEGFALDGTAYRLPGQALAVRIPGEGRSLWLVTGRDPERVAGLAGSVLLTASQAVRERVRGVEPFDYLVYETRYLERRGFWRPGASSGAMAVDREREVDRMAERDRAWASLVALPGRHVVLWVPPDRRGDPELADLARALDRAAAEMAPRVPGTLERPVEVVVERDYESLGRAFGRVAEAVVPEPPAAAKGDLHLVFHPGDLDAYRYGLACVLVGRAGLEPPPWLADGAALWLAGGWYGRGWRSYLDPFVAARVLPEAAELLAAERQAGGSAVIWPVAAAAVVDRLPGDDLRAKLAGGPVAARVEEALARLVARPLPPPAPPRAAGGPEDRWRGVSLAMTPGIENAYHGAGVDLQLARFAALGANAVAVMPYAFQRGPREPAIRVLHGEPGDENDAGLIHAARRARARGFRVLWKPHLWVSGSWPGEIEMGSEGDWRSWWRSYRRYVVHQAVLARFAGAELFAVGAELGGTVAREEPWRDLVASVRRLFPGRLTYAANWWNDFERVGFWDALDLIGVDAYFPLAESEEAGREELARGAREVTARLAEAARRHRRPMLLTELGYAARRGAWVQPHEEGGVLDEADQRLAYEVFLENLGRPEWLAGVFVWKAFSHPRVDRGGEAPDFRFLSRPAEEPIAAYFADGGRPEAPGGAAPPPDR